MIGAPLWLLGLLAVPAVIWAGLRQRAGARPRQHRAAVAVRALAVALLVLALADVRLPTAGSGVDVTFLVDASDSVAGQGTRAALDWVESALGARPDDGRAALALFGADARLEYTLRDDPSAADPATVVDGSATDVERALRLAQGALGSERRRRAVLLSDGRQTRGDAVRAAEELAAAGVAVDVVRLATGGSADVLVEEVVAPSRVRSGEAYDVTVRVRNTGTGPVEAQVTVSADGEEVHRATITAAPGVTEVVVPRSADEDGGAAGRTVRYTATISTGASTIAANDTARAAVQVDGPASVLVHDGDPGAGDDLAAALEASGLDVARGDVDAGLPALDQLLDHEAVLLVDVPIAALSDADLTALDTYVRSAGKGLVAVGGDSSFGMGDYEHTALEDLLPVFARVRDPQRRPSVAEALVVDVSGSMAACHCQEGGFAGGGDGFQDLREGGVVKTDIAKEAVARAVAALEADDTVGVLAFNTSSEWVVPLQQLPSQEVVDEGLARLHPEGGTSVAQAVREAIAGLRDVDARLRHIVLFSDGFTEDQALIDVAREAADAGITLSVVGTGEGSGDVLEAMAAAGGGRYYPGRDLASIPDIIVNEVQLVARPVVNEGSFLPVITGIAEATDDLDESPPLLGYLATTAKPTATTLLSIGAENDPLLSTWQAGLGTTVAWTSDAEARWSAQWVTWERFSSFWSDVVRSTFAATPDPRFDLNATASTEGIRVSLGSADPLPAGTVAVAEVVGPEGERDEVALERTAIDRFEAELPGGREGVYAVSVALTAAGETLFRDTVTATRSYSPEYAADEGDPRLLDRVAAAGQGRVDPDPATAFTAAGLAPGSAARPLAGWLALAALLLLPIDVGLRRLRLERGDWTRVRAWARQRLRRPAAVAEQRAATAGMLEAKRRARQRQDEGD